MPDFLTSSFANGPQVSPVEVLVRLLTALLLGLVIAFVYQRTRRNQDTSMSFPATLVLLCILIAMVTQVIGDNVARAFSLVGALSIVRFRTVVRDTQDTAYVIFAVIVGMAVGARSLWVALIGIAVVTLAEMLLRLRPSPSPQETSFLLQLRLSLSQDLDTFVRKALAEWVERSELMSVGTGKQGASLEATYRVRLKEHRSATELVRTLNLTEGVQSVQLSRCDQDEV